MTEKDNGATQELPQEEEILPTPEQNMDAAFEALTHHEQPAEQHEAAQTVPELPADETIPEEPETPEEPEEDAAAPVATPKKKGLNKVVYYALMTVFIGIFLYCAIYIANYMSNSQQAGSAYDELRDKVNQLKDQNASQDDPNSTVPSGSGQDITDNPTDDNQILPEYQQIYEMNNDVVGWITVPDTLIDYPVMQTPDRVDYYLYRDFNKEWSAWGCIYAREQCDVFTPSDNVVLYGHHMADKSMFWGLDKYKRESFWQDHQYITFDTLYEHHTYQVIAVFKTSANPGEGFSYHLFNTASSEEEFNQFIQTVHSLEFYDTGVTAEYGDMLLTLSTCEYTLSNGRFVVVAKRVS